jgi:hypothetical protein
MDSIQQVRESKLSSIFVICVKAVENSFRYEGPIVQYYSLYFHTMESTLLINMIDNWTPFFCIIN